LIDLLATGTAFQIGRHGEDNRFAGSKLRVPGNTLRDRKEDVLQPAELARRTYGSFATAWGVRRDDVVAGGRRSPDR
jgi:hypothetical protein